MAVIKLNIELELSKKKFKKDVETAKKSQKSIADGEKKVSKEINKSREKVLKSFKENKKREAKIDKSAIRERIKRAKALARKEIQIEKEKRAKLKQFGLGFLRTLAPGSSLGGIETILGAGIGAGVRGVIRTSVAISVASLAVGAVVAKQWLAANSALEKYQNRLNQLLSKRNQLSLAPRFQAQALAFARQTGFNVQDVRQAQINLVTGGLDPIDFTKTIKPLAELARFNRVSLKEVTNVFSQIQAGRTRRGLRGFERFGIGRSELETLAGARFTGKDAGKFAGNFRAALSAILKAADKKFGGTILKTLDETDQKLALINLNFTALGETFGQAGGATKAFKDLLDSVNRILTSPALQIAVTDFGKRFSVIVGNLNKLGDDVIVRRIETLGNIGLDLFDSLVIALTNPAVDTGVSLLGNFNVLFRDFVVQADTAIKTFKPILPLLVQFGDALEIIGKKLFKLGIIDIPDQLTTPQFFEQRRQLRFQTTKKIQTRFRETTDRFGDISKELLQEQIELFGDPERGARAIPEQEVRTILNKIFKSFRDEANVRRARISNNENTNVIIKALD